jgi:hypothetical protein
MTDVILPSWAIAAALGSILICCAVLSIVPAVAIVRSIRTAVDTLRMDNAHMREGLAAELRDVLEAAADRQVEATTIQQAQLGQYLASALQPPLQSVAQSLQEFSRSQSAEISHALEAQMAAFADKLDNALGGQVRQAKDLQQETARALEATVAAVEQLTKNIAATTESTNNALVTHLRAGISRTQVETEGNLKDLLNKLSSHVGNVIATIEQQASVANRTALEEQRKIVDLAQRAIDGLSGEVRSQTQAIESAAHNMRTAGADVAKAVDRITEGMTGLISGAAQEIMRSGKGFNEIFDKSSALSQNLAQTAAALAASSRGIGGVVTDYQSARETLHNMVEAMRSTAEAARKDASLATDFVDRIEVATQKLVAAQGQADQSLGSLRNVLADAQSAFGPHMLEKVRGFLAELNKETPAKPLSEEAQRRHTEFDKMISDWVQATPRFKPSTESVRESVDERQLVRAMASAMGRD